MTVHDSELGELKVNVPVKATPGVVPESTAVPPFFVTIDEVYVPTVGVLVNPLIWMETAVPTASIPVVVKEYVSVVPDSTTAPPAATLAGVTAPTVAVPPVPVGTVMVTELSLDLVAVVKV